MSHYSYQSRLFLMPVMVISGNIFNDRHPNYMFYNNFIIFSESEPDRENAKSKQRRKQVSFLTADTIVRHHSNRWHQRTELFTCVNEENILVSELTFPKF